LRNFGDTLIFIGFLAMFAVIAFGVWASFQPRNIKPALQSRKSTYSEKQAIAPPPAETLQPSPATSQPNPKPSAYPEQQPARPAPRAGSATAYKWVDEKGTTHFSDRPMNQGAEQIDMASVTILHSSQPQPVVRVADSRPQVNYEEVKAKPASYTSRAETTQVNRGVFQTSDGYLITASAKHFGEELSFGGRVENGPSCRALRLTAHLINQGGSNLTLSASASNVGSGSQLYESHKLRVDRLKCGWDVTSVQAYCVQR
jgi:hypothetical protein